MKKLLLLLIIAALWSCDRDAESERPEADRTHFSVDEAMSFYNDIMAAFPMEDYFRTRSGDGEEYPLLGISVSPQWERATMTTREKSERNVVDAPIAQVQKVTARWSAGGDSTMMKLHQRLIVVKELYGEAQGAYMLTLIPEPESDAPGVMDSFLHDDNRGGYCGMAIYSMPHTEGIVRLDIYDRGYRTVALSVFGDTEQNMHDATQIYEILEQLELYLWTSPQTRSHPDPDYMWDCGEIETVIITARKPYVITTFIFLDIGGGGRWICPDPEPIPTGPLGGAGLAERDKEDLAKDMFRNKNMTPENWKRLREALEKIIDDCLGAGLYNALLGALDGKTLIIEFDPNMQSNGTFTTSDGRITLKDGQSNVLLHEMFHAYQAYNSTYQGMVQASLNHELEAWYATYTYLKRQPEYTPGSEWHNKFHKSYPGMGVKELENFINNNGALISGTTNALLDRAIFSTVLPAFQVVPAYSGKSYDWNMTGMDNFKLFSDLAKGC